MLVLYVILGIIVTLLLIALVIPKELKASREVIINRPVSEVYDYIKYLKNQSNYSKWASMDPAMKNEYRGTDATPGFVHHWSGNKKVGEGEQEITALEEGKAIHSDLRFIRPFKSFAKVTMRTEAAEGGTRVTWGFDSKMNYPMNIMKLFMNMDNAVGNDFAIGLNNLKKVLEGK